MWKFLSVCAVLAVVPFAAQSALAGGKQGTVGVGAERQLSGLGGASIVYDMGTAHVGGFLVYSDDGDTDDTDLGAGGRFYYHVHSTAMSDFGVGGSLGFVSIGDRVEGVDRDRTEAFLEPSMQFRAFVASNVGLSPVHQRPPELDQLGCVRCFGSIEVRRDQVI
jgi:hypothetical protein